jgi:Fur family transcriptional regulator, ferric uptake regulator
VSGGNGSATTDVHEAVAARLGQLEQRYTKGRRAVVEVLAAAGGPLTITEILETDGSLSQSSAYRNLAELEQLGAIHRIVTDADHARFELAEELTGEHHHHLVCSGCGIVVDVALPEALEHALDEQLERLAGIHRFRAQHHRLDLVGRCADCA